MSTSKGWHHKRYSVIAITLHYIFALLHNVISVENSYCFDSYRFRLFAGVIASDSYSSELAGQRFHFSLLSL